MKAVIAFFALMISAPLAAAEQPRSVKLYSEIAYEENDLTAVGASQGRELTTRSALLGVDVIDGNFVYGGLISPRRITGEIGAGPFATDVRATGAQLVGYGAWSPVQPLYLGVVAVVQQDEGVFEGAFGVLDSRLRVVEGRAFVTAFAPLAGGLIRADMAAEVIHGRLEIETTPDSLFTDLNGFFGLHWTSPSFEGATLELGGEARHIFREDVLLGGAKRDPWSVNFSAKLTAPITDQANLVLSGAIRAFDKISDDRRVALRIETSF